MKQISLFILSLCFAISLHAQGGDIFFSLDFPQKSAMPDSISQLRLSQVCAQLTEHLRYDLEIKSYTADYPQEMDNQRLLEQRLQLILEQLEQQPAQLESIQSSHQLNGNAPKSYIKISIRVVADRNAKAEPKQPQPENPQIQATALSWIEEQQKQVFKFAADSAQLLVGREGSQILVPKNAFYYPNGQAAKGQIQLNLIEANLPSSRVLLAAPTMSNGKAIQTGGSLLVTAQDSAGNQLNTKPSKPVKVSFPDERQWLPGMQIYTAQRQNGQPLNWQSTSRAISVQPQRRPLSKVVTMDWVAGSYRILDSCIEANKVFMEKIRQQKAAFLNLGTLSDEKGRPRTSKHTNSKKAQSYLNSLQLVRQFLQQEQMAQLPILYAQLLSYDQELFRALNIHSKKMMEAVQELQQLKSLVKDADIASKLEACKKMPFLNRRFYIYRSPYHLEADSRFWLNLAILQDLLSKQAPQEWPSKREERLIGKIFGEDPKEKTELYAIFAELEQLQKTQEKMRDDLAALQQSYELLQQCQQAIEQKRQPVSLEGLSQEEIQKRLALESEIEQLLPASSPIPLGVWINCDRILATSSARPGELRTLRLKIKDSRVKAAECMVFLELSRLDVTTQLSLNNRGEWCSMPLDNRDCELNILQFLPDGKVLAYKQKGNRKALQAAKITLQELKIADLADFLRQ